MFTCKKHFRCNSLQAASKVLYKYGSPCWTRTNDLRINRASFYINSRFSAFNNIWFYPINISFSQHFKSLSFAGLRQLCSKIVPKFFVAKVADAQTRHASGLGGWRVSNLCVSYMRFAFASSIATMYSSRKSSAPSSSITFMSSSFMLYLLYLLTLDGDRAIISLSPPG